MGNRKRKRRQESGRSEITEERQIKGGGEWARKER